MTLDIPAISARVADWCVARRYLLFIASVLSTLALATGLLATQFDGTFNALLTESDPYLDELERMLMPWCTEMSRELGIRAKPNYQLVKATERYFRTLETDEKLDVSRMAQQIGYSRRSVFHAYRSLLGIGPRRYLELMRLQKLRLRLKQAMPEETNVTTEAARFGFFHPGRLPQLYRNQFGENPVDTLNRVA